MKPRSFLATFFSVALFSGTLFGIGMGIIFTAIGVVGLGETAEEIFPIIMQVSFIGGIPFGIIFGFIMAIGFRGITITESYPHKRTFELFVDTLLQDLGYRLLTQDERSSTYKPTVKTGIAAGKFHVQYIDGTCTLLGAKHYIKKIQQRLAQARIEGLLDTPPVTAVPSTAHPQASVKPSNGLEAAYAAPYSSQQAGTIPTIPVLPQNCAACTAPLSLDNVRWIGPLSAICPNCGTNIEIEWRKLG